jgi:ribonuclease HI
MNYAAHDLELVAIVHALKMWRHYLMGKKFELRTDHNGLKYMFQQTTLNPRQTRWLEVQSMTLTSNISKEKNKVTDALDIRVHIMHATTIGMHQSDLNNIILDVVVEQHYLQVKESLQQEGVQQKFK